MAATYNSTAAIRRSNGSLRGPVGEIQRARVLAAAVETVEELGYARMSVAQVIGRAGVSRKTFYDLFADREDCFLAAFEQTHSQAWLLATEAFAREASWREGIRSALSRLLRFIEEEPGLARLWIVEAMAGGERVLERRAQALKQFAKAIDRGRLATSRGLQPPDAAALGVVGAVLTVLEVGLLDGAETPPTELLNSLMNIVVLPYLGPRAASRELRRRSLEASREEPLPRARYREDPLAGLNMRLTHRTVRVLTVVAMHSGASNREIATRSGIVDEGQISKLLDRLTRLNLVENRSGGHEKGAANAWFLTARGAQLERVARPR